MKKFTFQVFFSFTENDLLHRFVYNVAKDSDKLIRWRKISLTPLSQNNS